MKMLVPWLLALMLIATANAGEEYAELGHREDTSLLSGERSCPGYRVYNHDGSFENGYSWAYVGVAPPYYGCFGEAFAVLGPTRLLSAELWLTQVGGYSGAPVDIYVWEGGLTCAPDAVLCLVPGVTGLTIPNWPTVGLTEIPIDCDVPGEFTVGYWVEAAAEEIQFFIAADEDGYGGFPWTCIAPGIGFPTGWNHPNIVSGWSSCKSLGIGACLSLGDSPYLVCPDGSGDFLTIQAGIDHAQAGETVELCDGTFTGVGNHDLDYGGKAITVRSRSGNPEACVIDCEGAGRGFYFHAGEDSSAVLEGITITNGFADYGGAIRRDSASPTLRNCIFLGNTAAHEGGAIRSGGLSSSRCRGCLFCGNSCGNNCGGVYLYRSNDTFEECVFADNTGSGVAGAVYIHNCNPTFTDCTFYGNTGGGQGGALRCYQAYPNLSGCTLYGNGAVSGGGIYSLSSSPTLENTIIAFSTQGAAIVCGAPGSASLTCCDVYGNGGGDWVGCIASQYGVDGNISADPLFCGAESDDFTLWRDSPCAEENSPVCGQIGAWPVGCYAVGTYFVSPDGTGDFATIQAAIDALPDGSIVELGDGTFTGLGNRDILYRGKALTVRSASGDPETCVIDCEGAGRGFGFQSLEGSGSVLEAVTVTHGGTVAHGGALYVNNARPAIRGCRFVGNSSWLAGGAAQFTQSLSRVTGCEFIGNASTSVGGAVNAFLADVEFSGCIFVDNSAGDQGGGLRCKESDVLLRSCTLQGNVAPAGGGLFCEDACPSVENVIISWSGDGAAVEGAGSWDATLICCDLYGNADGDWVGAIADQYGAGGNISRDPVFCDAAGGDFHLAHESPCAPSDECDLIGAFGMACGMRISAITDVGNDQGRQVRVRWTGAANDIAGAPQPITEYSLWRRIDENFAASGGRVTEAQRGRELRGDGLRYPPGEWDFVMTVPACGEEDYATVCPTLCDSTIAGGQCWSVFFVRAHTESPVVYFDSQPDSGYSLDNLAPGAPEGFRLETPTMLAWEEAPEEDFDYFTVYGSELDELDPSAVVIGCTAGTTMNIEGHDYPFYHLTATDFGGNEGQPATLGAARLFVRGDTDASGEINISDPIYSLAYQFAGGPAPPCLDAADYDDSGEVNISDPIANLAYQFAGGPCPGPPFPGCGADPPDASLLGCGGFSPCDARGAKTRGPQLASAGGDDRSVGGNLRLDPVFGEDSRSVTIGVALECVEDLLGFEFTVGFDAELFDFVALDAEGLAGAGLDFLSAHCERGTGEIKVGAVPDLAMAEPLRSGSHELARLVLSVRRPPLVEESQVMLLSARLVDTQMRSSGVGATLAGIGSPMRPGLFLENPLRPNAVISLNLTESSPARLEIYDVAGRRVRRLIAADLPAGHNEIVWDGRSDDGARIAAGVYYLQAAVGAEELQRKILVIR